MNTVDLNIPTTILTQLGVMSVLPKLARYETKKYAGRKDPETGAWVCTCEGYCKRHERRRRDAQA